MSDYFHEAMVAKMVSSNEYQQGYLVGYTSGYEQGKAETKGAEMSKEKTIRQIADDIADILIEESQQFKNTNNTMSLLACDIEKLYQQGRADAIDEFTNALINPNNYESYDFDECLSDSDKANDFCKYVFAMAEKMKEQNK